MNMELISDGTSRTIKDEWDVFFKGKIDDLAKERADIYAPSDESVRQTIEPFYNSVKDDINTLLDLGSKLSLENVSEADAFEVVKFFAKKFGVKDDKKIELMDGDEASGSYNHYHRRIKLGIRKTGSVADIIEAIAHEVWHAHQYEVDSEPYRTNNEYYYKCTMDYDAYFNQLIEKEAYTLDDMVGTLYVRAELQAHPERVPDLIKKYHEWLDGKYKPREVRDGIDYKYLTVAYDDYGDMNRPEEKQVETREERTETQERRTKIQERGSFIRRLLNRKKGDK